MLNRGQRVVAYTGRWALRLSGPVAVLVAMLILFRPGVVPGTSAPPMVRPVSEPRQTATARVTLNLPAGVCTDPAISGCDAYSACAVAVTITSGLAPDPRQTLAQGLQECVAGSR